MTMLKQIFTNEIRGLIGHEPSEAEYKSAFEYVEEGLRSNHTLSDINVLLYDWRDDCMMECHACGEYFLAETMIKNDFGYNFCSRDCEIEHEHEQEYESEHQRELTSTWNE